MCLPFSHAPYPSFLRAVLLDELDAPDHPPGPPGAVRLIPAGSDAFHPFPCPFVVTAEAAVVGGLYGAFPGAGPALFTPLAAGAAPLVLGVNAGEAALRLLTLHKMLVQISGGKL